MNVNETLERIVNLLGLSEGDDPVAAVAALKSAADVVPNLERRIDSLNEEIGRACHMLGCDFSDAFLSTLRARLERLEDAEYRLRHMEAERLRALEPGCEEAKLKAARVRTRILVEAALSSLLNATDDIRDALEEARA